MLSVHVLSHDWHVQYFDVDRSVEQAKILAMYPDTEARAEPDPSRAVGEELEGVFLFFVECTLRICPILPVCPHFGIAPRMSFLFYINF
jgi:hypothetical protein